MNKHFLHIYVMVYNRVVVAVCGVLQEVYSKGIISTAFMTNVSSVGELKFEVVTNNRTFIFRAESEGLSVFWLVITHTQNNMSQICLHTGSHVTHFSFIHVFMHPSSWEKRVGDCTTGLHQGAPSSQHHKPKLTFDPRLSGLSGAQRVTLQTLYCCCLR